MIAIAHNFIGHLYSTLGLIVICIYIFNILAQFDEFNLIINLRYLKKNHKENLNEYIEAIIPFVFISRIGKNE